MPSQALLNWETNRQAALDELEVAHRSVGGSRRGRRYTTQQLNRAYALLLSSQFQGFCRDLHDECIDLVGLVAPAGIPREMVKNLLETNRKLDRGNPNPGNIGEDFNRFELSFWRAVVALDPRNEQRRQRLEELNTWRNAIAHHDFRGALVRRAVLHIRQVREWRGACQQLAAAFDQVMGDQLQQATGQRPW